MLVFPDKRGLQMTHGFDEEYWESHWRQAPERSAGREPAVNPHLLRAAMGVSPGAALDAGSGAGGEAIWLAHAGWDVTAVDISPEAQRRAAEREALNPPADLVEWVVADLDDWQPERQFDLVCTHYAHPAGPQLGFYERISRWVAPGGMLLIVGHLHDHEHHDDEHHDHDHDDGNDGPPPEASVRAADVVALLDGDHWSVQAAEELHRSIENGAGSTVELHDVVVIAVRLGTRRAHAATT